MSLNRTACLAAILTFSLTGCFFRKRPPALPGVPPPQAKSTTATLDPAPPPPKIESKIPESVPPVSVKLPDAPKPPQAKQTPRRTRRATPAAAKSQTAPASPPSADPGSDAGPPAPAPPQLGDLLTDAQKAELLKKCDQALQSARGSLEKLTSKTLSAAEAESAGRARVFLLQAEQARAKDPQTALQLAQRADVLARDLLKSLR